RAASGPSRDAIALATTADPSEQTRRELIGAGFLDVVIKPVSLESLRALLAKHLPSLQLDAVAREDRFDPGRLNDERALAAVGGDASILAALRGLLVAELDALPSEVAAIVARGDVAAMRDRLHRLDASAGFCGVPGLVEAGTRLRAVLDDAAGPPSTAVDEFLVTAAEIRARLTASRPASR
ncbi:MAG TPA: hypothetical protein VH375_01490, partial [Rhodanobacteraceae bacterium]